jgi:hypothetical protein
MPSLWGPRSTIHRILPEEGYRFSSHNEVFIFLKGTLEKYHNIMILNVTFISVILLKVRQQTGDCMKPVFSIQFYEDNLMDSIFPFVR